MEDSPLVWSCVYAGWMNECITPEKFGPTSSAWRSMLSGCCGEGQTRQTLVTSQASGCLRQGLVVQSRNARLAVSGERVRFLFLRLFCSSSLPRRAVTASTFHLPRQKEQQNHLSVVCPQFCNLSLHVSTQQTQPSPWSGNTQPCHAYAPETLGAICGFRETGWKDSFSHCCA